MLRILVGVGSILLGLGIWAIAISVLLTWLAFCFGTVIIGLIMMFVCPTILFAPLAIGAPGTALIVMGSLILKKDPVTVSNFRREEEMWTPSSKIYNSPVLLEYERKMKEIEEASRLIKSGLPPSNESQDSKKDV